MSEEFITISNFISVGWDTLTMYTLYECKTNEQAFSLLWFIRYISNNQDNNRLNELSLDDMVTQLASKSNSK